MIMPPLTPNSRIIGDIESDGGLLASIGSHTKDDEFSPHHEKEKTKLFMPSPLSITETSLVLHSHFRHESNSCLKIEPPSSRAMIGRKRSRCSPDQIDSLLRVASDSDSTRTRTNTNTNTSIIIAKKKKKSVAKASMTRVRINSTADKAGDVKISSSISVRVESDKNRPSQVHIPKKKIYTRRSRYDPPTPKINKNSQGHKKQVIRNSNDNGTEKINNIDQRKNDGDRKELISEHECNGAIPSEDLLDNLQLPRGKKKRYISIGETNDKLAYNDDNSDNDKFIGKTNAIEKEISHNDQSFHTPIKSKTSEKSSTPELQGDTEDGNTKVTQKTMKNVSSTHSSKAKRTIAQVRKRAGKRKTFTILKAVRTKNKTIPVRSTISIIRNQKPISESRNEGRQLIDATRLFQNDDHFVSTSKMTTFKSTSSSTPKRTHFIGAKPSTTKPAISRAMLSQQLNPNTVPELSEKTKELLEITTSDDIPCTTLIISNNTASKCSRDKLNIEKQIVSSQGCINDTTSITTLAQSTLTYIEDEMNKLNELRDKVQQKLDKPNNKKKNDLYVKDLKQICDSSTLEEILHRHRISSTTDTQKDKARDCRRASSKPKPVLINSNSKCQHDDSIICISKRGLNHEESHSSASTFEHKFNKNANNAYNTKTNEEQSAYKVHTTQPLNDYFNKSSMRCLDSINQTCNKSLVAIESKKKMKPSSSRKVSPVLSPYGTTWMELELESSSNDDDDDDDDGGDADGGDESLGKLNTNSKKIKCKKRRRQQIILDSDDDSDCSNDIENDEDDDSDEDDEFNSNTDSNSSSSLSNHEENESDTTLKGGMISSNDEMKKLIKKSRIKRGETTGIDILQSFGQL